MREMKKTCDWCDQPLGRSLSKSKYRTVSDSVEYLCQSCAEDAEYCPYCGKIGHPDWFHDDFVIDQETGEIQCVQCYAKQFGVRRVWHSTDPWRGHYAFEPIDKRHAIAVECCLVPHDQNEEIVKIVLDFLHEHGFQTKALTGRTSNVFSRNLVIVAWKDRRLNKKEREMLKKIDTLFVDYYTRGFSILSGETFPIDIKWFKRELDSMFPKYSYKSGKSQLLKKLKASLAIKKRKGWSSEIGAGFVAADINDCWLNSDGTITLILFGDTAHIVKVKQLNLRETEELIKWLDLQRG